jgi:hypothetical protein
VTPIADSMKIVHPAGLISVLLAVFCLANGSLAQTAGNLARDRQGSFFSVSPRLIFYTLVQKAQPGTEAAVVSLAQGLGFLHRQGKGLQRAWNITSLQPVLSYNPNINGGLAGETFTIGGLVFKIDPESQAVAGPVVGGALSKSAGWSIGTGQTVSLAGNVEIVYSPDYDISRTNASGQACLRSYLQNWQFLDLCGGAFYEKADLSEADGSFLSANFARLFSTRGGTGLANASINREFQQSYQKTSVSAGIERYFDGRGVVTARVAVGEEIEGENTLLYGGYLSYGQLVLGVGTNIGLSYEREGGDTFFGQDRTDDVITLNLTGQISPTLSATISVEDRTSSIDLFDGVTVNLDLNVLRLQF